MLQVVLNKIFQSTARVCVAPLLLVTMFACLSVQSFAQDYSPARATPHPFSIHYVHYQFHIMLFLEDHPEYEAVEAFITETPSLSIRAIITAHDQTQVDYYNTEKSRDELKSLGLDRAMHYAEISYKRTGKNGGTKVSMQFDTVEGKKIDFFMDLAAEPMTKYGGLVDPEGHSPTTSLPVMYRESSALAGSKSFVSFDGKKYSIPVLVDASPFFKGYKGYFSNEMRIAVLRAGKSTIEPIEAPVKFNPGERWVYRENGIEETWTITELSGTRIRIDGINEIVIAEVLDGQIGIKKIQSKGDDPEKTFTIEFGSPLFVSGIAPQNSNNTFSIGLAGKENLVVGDFSLEASTAGYVFRLIPKKPDWAKPRIVTITETRGANGISRNCTIGE